MTMAQRLLFAWEQQTTARDHYVSMEYFNSNRQEKCILGFFSHYTFFDFCLYYYYYLFFIRLVTNWCETSIQIFGQPEFDDARSVTDNLYSIHNEDWNWKQTLLKINGKYHGSQFIAGRPGLQALSHHTIRVSFPSLTLLPYHSG